MKHTEVLLSNDQDINSSIGDAEYHQEQINKLSTIQRKMKNKPSTIEKICLIADKLLPDIQ